MPTLNLLEEQFWQLCWDIGRFVVTIGSLVLASRMEWSARTAVSLYSAAMMFGYLSHLGLSRYAIQRRIEQFVAAGKAGSLSEQAMAHCANSESSL